MTTPQIKYDPTKLVAQELWGLDKIRNEPLRPRVRSEDVKDGPGGPVRRQEIYYTSHVWRGQAIRIAAHVALPLGKGKLPAMVLGAGSLDSAESFARTHNVACVAIDRPGTGDSNGPADVYQTWIALEEDPRDGWMWHYVTSVLRAITYMQQQAEVDGAKVGVTGGSRGGTMSLIANGVDDRIKLCVPTATCGDILTAFDHGGWANYLYTKEDGTPGIPTTFRIFALYGDPIHYAKTQHGAVYLILGAQDEYFPIYTVKTTCDALAGEWRLELIPDWDHGLFSVTNEKLGTYDNRQEANRRQSACMKAAIECYLHGKARMPHAPLLSWFPSADGLEFTATVDLSRPVAKVDLIHSTDGAYLFKRTAMTPVTESFRQKFKTKLPLSSCDANRLVVYVEVEYQDGPFITSVPEFGMLFRQAMRERPEAPPAEWLKEEITYPSSIDNLSIRVAVAYNKQRKGAPILVVLAGGVPGSRKPAEEEIERLARRGLFVVAPSLRGRDGSQGQCDCTGREVYDVLDAVEHVKAKFGEFVNTNAVSVLGYSAGGVVALLAGVRFPDYFRCIVSYFAPQDRGVMPYWELLRRKPKGEGEERAMRIAKMVAKHVGGAPDKAADAYAARRVVTALGNIPFSRIVLFHDMEDPLVPCAQSEALTKRAAELGMKNVTLHVSWPDDGRRWQHGHPNNIPDLRAAEDKFIGFITNPNATQPPSLASSGKLIVLGYLKTKQFEVWLGDGRAAVAEMDYSLGRERMEFQFHRLAGAADTPVRLSVSTELTETWDVTPSRPVQRRDGMVTVSLGVQDVVAFVKAP